MTLTSLDTKRGDAVAHQTGIEWQMNCHINLKGERHDNKEKDHSEED